MNEETTAVPAFSERRRAPRKENTYFCVWVKKVSSDGLAGAPSIMISDSVSFSGARVIGADFEIGTIVQVAVSPDPEPPIIQGTVIWTDVPKEGHPRVGIRFDGDAAHDFFLSGALLYHTLGRALFSIRGFDDISDVFSQLFRIIRRLTNSTGAMIHLYDPTTHDMVLYTSDSSEFGVKDVHFKISDCACNSFVSDPDIPYIRNNSASHCCLGDNSNTYSIVCIPLQLPNDRGLLGCMCVLYNKEDIHVFPDKLPMLSPYIATCVDLGIRRHVHAQRRLFEKHLVHLPLQALQQQAVDAVRDALNAESCSLFLATHDRKSLSLQASSMMTNDRGRICYDLNDNDESMKHPTAKVFLSAEPLLVNDISTHHRASGIKPGFSDVRNPDVAHSFLGVPFSDIDGHICGTLRVTNRMPSKSGKQLIDRGRYFNIIDQLVLAELAASLGAFYSHAQQIEEASKMVLSATHEITNPLQLMVSGLRILQNSITKNQAFGSYHSQLISDMQMTAELVNILNSNMSAFLTYITPDRRLTDLYGQVIAKVVGMCRPYAELAIEYNDIKTLPALYIDKFHFVQVFYNLLINALKYGDPSQNKAIQINSLSLPDRFIITIMDYGLPIPPSEVDSIFQWEHRTLAAKQLGKTKGQGRGLYITRRILAAYGGLVYVAQANDPVIFAVELPKLLMEHDWKAANLPILEPSASLNARTKGKP